MVDNNKNNDKHSQNIHIHRVSRNISLYKGIRLGIMKYIGQANLSISLWNHSTCSNNKHHVKYNNHNSNTNKEIPESDNDLKNDIGNDKLSVFLLKEERKNLEELVHYS